MKNEKRDDIAWAAGELIQNMIFFTETGRNIDAKKVPVYLAEIREEARNAGMDIGFFQKRSYVRLLCPVCGGPHVPNADELAMAEERAEGTPVTDPSRATAGHRPHASRIGKMGEWRIDEERMRAHYHVTVEIIFDGTVSGGVRVIPGDITIEPMPVPDASEFLPDDSQKSENDFDDDFLRGLGIKDPRRGE